MIQNILTLHEMFFYQGPFGGTTDCPYFGFCVTLLMGFKAIWPSLFLACSGYIWCYRFAPIGVYTKKKACGQQACLPDITHVPSFYALLPYHSRKIVSIGRQCESLFSLIFLHRFPLFSFDIFCLSWYSKLPNF